MEDILSNCLPEIQRMIFNLLSPNQLHLIHRTCKNFRGLRYREQLIPLYLFDNIFGLDFYDLYKKFGAPVTQPYISLDCAMIKISDDKYNLSLEYLYCLRDHIGQLIGDFTRWDTWYWFVVDAKYITQTKAIESRMYKSLYGVSTLEYNKYYKNNRLIKAII